MAAFSAARTPTNATIAELLHANRVALEHLRSQANALLEAITRFSERLEAEIVPPDSRLSERISVIEEAVRQDSSYLHRFHAEVARLRDDFDHREERGQDANLKFRVGVLELRLGIKSV